MTVWGDLRAGRCGENCVHSRSSRQCCGVGVVMVLPRPEEETEAQSFPERPGPLPLRQDWDSSLEQARSPLSPPRTPEARLDSCSLLGSLKLGQSLPCGAGSRGVRRCVRGVGHRWEAVPSLEGSAGALGREWGEGSAAEGQLAMGGCSGAGPHPPTPSHRVHLCQPHAQGHLVKSLKAALVLYLYHGISRCYEPGLPPPTWRAGCYTFTSTPSWHNHLACFLPHGKCCHHREAPQDCSLRQLANHTASC